MQEYDFIVIGAGSGGVRAARMSAGHGAKVAIIEERYLGGTCVNVGCVPKKLFSYGAHFHADFEDAKGFGWSTGTPEFDWPTLRDNKNTEIKRLNGIYENMLKNAGVDIINGHGEFTGPNTVSVNGVDYTAPHILIAVGGWPVAPNIPGVEHAISSNEIFYLDELPKSMAIVGGGYIASEFASIMNGLGVDVTQYYRRELFLRGFDQEIREVLAREMRNAGVNLQFNENVTAVEKRADGQLELTLENGEPVTVGALMFATGRAPLLKGLGLEHTGVELNDNGTIKADECFNTTAKGVYALGDVTGGMELTPVALAEGMALAHRLFGNFDGPKGEGTVDLDNVATAIFTHPNVATVGLSEASAVEKFGKVAVFTSEFRHLKHTLSGSSAKTFLKLLVDVESDKVVGAHMVGDDAGELVQGLAIAIKAGATKAVFDSTIGIHPTVAEEFVTLREATRIVES